MIVLSLVFLGNFFIAYYRNNKKSRVFAKLKTDYHLISGYKKVDSNDFKKT